MDYSIKSTKDNMSERKKQGYLKLSQIIQWGRMYPV